MCFPRAAIDLEDEIHYSCILKLEQTRHGIRIVESFNSGDSRE
jgi:hypothetical protein